MKKNKIAFIVLCLFCTACKSGKGIVEENIKFADKQFDYAFTCIDKTLASENESRTKDLTNPRSIEKDGSLRMVKSKDWCSGFFPGSLWYMYEYTGNKKWESKAAAYSWLIEQEKWNAGTHDMDFKMYPSFGNAYRLKQEMKMIKEVGVNFIRLRYFKQIREARPDQELVKKALEEFTENSKFKFCTKNEGYIKALGMNP